MRTSFFPSKDADLLAWSKNLSEKLLDSPGQYGISPEQAAEFAAMQAGFSAAMLDVAPSVRNKTAVTGKNDARESLKARARLIRSIIFGQPDVTDAQKISLGFNVPRGKTPIPPPDAAPAVRVSSTDGHTVTVRLSDSTTLGRSRPPEASGASIFTFTGDEPPGDLSGWKHALSTTRRTVKITFPASVPPGSRVWVCAYWTNPRSQPGPTSAPIGSWIQFGGSIVIASLNRTSSAIAA